MKQQPNHRLSLPLAVASAITLVACQATPVTKTMDGQVGSGSGTTSQIPLQMPDVANAGGQTPAGTVAANANAVGTQNNAVGANGGTNNVGGAKSVIKADSKLTRDQALVGAKAMQIKAAEGGKYVSADGSLSVTIPPGALTQDATVRFAPVDTSSIGNSTAATPGIMFAADLGGAKVADNASLTVTSKADPRLVADAQKNVPGFTPAMFNLTQDSSGAWNMQMPIHGDYTNGAQPPAPVTGSNWSLQEFAPAIGNRIIANSSAGIAAAPSLTNFFLLDVPSTDTPSATPTSTPTPAPTPTPCTLTTIPANYSVIDNLPAMPCDKVNNYPYIPSTTWWTGQVVVFASNPFDPAANAAQKIDQVVADTKAAWGEFFVCLGFWHTDCLGTVNDALYAVETYNQAVAHHRQPTDAMRATAFSYYQVNGQTVTNCNASDLRNMVVNMQFTSDDPAAAGPITNGTVTFGSGAATVSATTDSNGNASQAFYPTYVAYSAGWPNPNGLTAAPIANAYSGATTIVANNVDTYHINLTWAKNSPLYTVNLTGDAVIKDPQITYSLDGVTKTIGAADLVSSSGVGTKSSSLSFRTRLGDDTANHTFQLLRVTAGNLAMQTVDAQMPAQQATQRTKSYSFNVNIYNLATK